MKNNQLSFLFFFIFWAGSGYSQISRDSITHLYQAIVNPHGNSNHIPEAINFYIVKKDKDLKRKDTLSAVNDLRLIAMGQFSIGNSYDSESAAVEALGLIDSYAKKDAFVEARKALYNQLGQIYRDSNSYNKAIENYNYSLQLSNSFSDSIKLINNKANIYKDAGNYKKARDQLNIALNKMGQSTDSLLLATVLDNLGYVQSKLGNPAALTNLNKALQIRENAGDLSKTYASYNSLALYYFEANDQQQADTYANKAYHAATKLHSIKYLQDALSLFVIMDEDPKIVRFKTITDSIDKDKQLAENKNAFIKYNVANEKKKTNEALLQKEKEKSQKLIVLALGIIIFITALAIVFTLRIKHKKDKILEVQNTESRISKKVHDEVANDIYHIMAKIQSKEENKEALLDDLENIYNKTRDISKENSAIEIHEDFNEQLNDLLLSYQNEKVNIATRNSSRINWHDVSNIKKATIYRVLQELMTNMKKHSNASVVVLNFQTNNKKITIEYTDNGKGCELKDKNGLLNAENRMHTINGTITFDSRPQHGFRAKITV